MNPSPAAPPLAPTGARPLGASLRRSSGDRLLLGVCGGVGRSTGSSALALRVATWALAVVLLPVVVLAYLVTALILPRDDGATLIGPGPRDRRDVILAVLTTLVAAPIVLGAADGSLLNSDPVPVLVIGAVALGVARIVRGRSAAQTQAAAPAMPATAGAGAATGWVDAAPGARGASDPFSGTITGPYADEPEAPTTDRRAAAASTSDPVSASTEAPEAPTFVRPGTLSPPHEGEEPTFVRPGGRPIASTGEEPTFVRPGQGPPNQVPGEGGGGDSGQRGGGGDDGGSGPGMGGSSPQTPPPASRRRGLALPVVSVLVLIPAIFVVLTATGAIDAGASAWAILLALLAVASAGGAVAIAVLRPSYLGAGLLVILATCFGASSVGVSQIAPVLDDGLGERAYRPSGADELLRPYTLGLGELTIDLRDLDLADRSRTRLQAKLGYGELRIIVPSGVRVTTAPGSQAAGLTASARRTGATAAEAAGAPVVELDLDVRGGQVDLLAGSAKRVENLDRVASQSTGFWGSDTLTEAELRRDAAQERADRLAEERAAAEQRAADRRDAEADRAPEGGTP